jgi:hypothetical protein
MLEPPGRISSGKSRLLTGPHAAVRHSRRIKTFTLGGLMGFTAGIRRGSSSLRVPLRPR